MSKRVTFLSDVGPDSPGAFQHVQRKIAMLRRAGCAVTLEQSPSLGQWARTPDRLVRQEPERRSQKSDVLYARIAPRTVPEILLWQRRSHKPTVLEWNGHVVEDFRHGWQQRTIGALTSRVASDPHTLNVGDRAYEGYAKSMGERVRWIELPLPVGPVSLQDTAAPDPVIRFIGSLQPWQGLEELVTAWRAAPTKGFQLEIIGSGTMQERLEDLTRSDDDIKLVGRVSAEEAEDLANRAAGLLAPYPPSRGADHPLSSLKTLMYALTSRPMLTTSRDTLLDIPELDAVHTWDGASVASLTQSLTSLMDDVHSDVRAVGRRARVLADRGIDNGARRLTDIIARL